MSRIIFAVLFGFVIVGLCLFTAWIYGAAFRVGMRRELTIPSLFFPLTWIASLIAVRSAWLGIGPVLYTFINILAGVFFYLFLGAIVLAGALLIAGLAGTPLPLPVSVTVLIASLVLAAIGLIQARTLTATAYTVHLTGAPASWEGKRAVLVSDTHFGLINHRRFSEKIVNRILALNPTFVLHAGDFYDGPMVATAPITDSWKQLTDTVPVFYAPGNHEAYGDYAAFIRSISAAGITVLEDRKTLYEGVQIAGITFRQRSQEALAARAIEGLGLDLSSPAILINHPPTFQRQATHAGIDLMVSGHTHRGQFWPVNFLVRAIYKRYAYGLQHTGELTTITTSGVGTFGPPFRLFNPPELVVLTFTTTEAQKKSS